MGLFDKGQEKPDLRSDVWDYLDVSPKQRHAATGFVDFGGL
jgi:hypothetical protein